MTEMNKVSGEKPLQWFSTPQNSALQVAVLDQMGDVGTHKIKSPHQTDTQPYLIIHKLKIKI